MMEPSFGGINLEDIKAPECFIIEQTLRERMKIPVMHDDQHGTAIIAAAGLINACLLTGRKMDEIKVVVNGAGASALACTALIKSMGVRNDRVTVCDSKGVIWRGRPGVDQFKSAARDRDRGPHAGRCDEGRRRVPRPLGRGRGQPGHGQVDGAPADHLRDGQPRPGDHAAGRGRGPPRRDRRHRPFGLPEPGQQRARLPVHLPRRARRAGDRDQRGDEDRRRACDRRTGARAGARGSRRRLRRAITSSGATTSSRRRSIRG